MRFGLNLVALLLVCSACLAGPAPVPEFGGHHGASHFDINDSYNPVDEGHGEGGHHHHHEEGHHDEDGDSGASRYVLECNGSMSTGTRKKI